MYGEEPVTMAKDFFGRQEKHVILTNEILSDQDNRMRIEIEHLRQSRNTAANLDLIKAATSLCLNEYQRYKANQRRALQDLQKTVTVGADGITTI